MRDIPLRVWQKKYADGEFNKNDFNTMCAAGWYDWFCDVSSLKRKLDKMAPIVTKLQNSTKINLDTMYVWFKNNCPMVGPLYDDIRISDIQGGSVIYTINIDSKYNREKYNSKYVVWGRVNNFKEPLFVCNDSRELVKWLNS